MIYVACSANEPYIPRIRPYLESLARHLRGTPITPVLVAVNCAQPFDVPVKLAHCDTRTLPYAPPLDHLQAGGFLDAIPGADDDVIIFTDGDIVMQRPPSAAELAYFADWPADSVGVGYNAGPDDTLYTEYWRLQPTQAPAAGLVNAYSLMPCYNTGVVIARRSLWREWFQLTAAAWPKVNGMFGHYAKQQWCMNYAMAAAGIPAIVLPQSIHTHGCYALPHGCVFDAGGLSYLGTPVLFRHHV